MFYISPWMLYGLTLCTIYFVLVLLGYEGRRHENNITRKKTVRKLETSEQTVKAYYGEKEEESGQGEHDKALGKKELRNLKSDSRDQKQNDAVTVSSFKVSLFESKKSFDEVKLAAAGSKKDDNLIVEQTIKASNAEDVLESRDALYLQEFNVTGNFISERNSIRSISQGSENAREIDRNELSPSPEAIKHVDLSENITQAFSSSVCSSPFDTEHAQSPLSVGVKELHSSTDLQKSTLFADFSNQLVSKVTTKALQDIDLEYRAHCLAERISSDIIDDVLSQFATRSISRNKEVKSCNIQELHSFAGNVIDSVIQQAAENLSSIQDIDLFAKDLSEQVISDGIEIYAVTEKAKQGQKQKVSLGKVKLFSEGVVSVAVSDGIDEALGRDTSDVEGVSVVQNSADGVLGLSKSIQPHVSGVVENIVNSAIYEAALRVNKEPQARDSAVDSCAREVLESQVNEIVQELLVSALQEAADCKRKVDGNTLENEGELKSSVESFVDETLVAAVKEATGRVLDQQNTSVAGPEQKLLNGHVDIASEPTSVIIDLGQGVDEVPFKQKKDLGELNVIGANDSNNYWRKSLILDLEENEEEFEESIESGKSAKSTADSQDLETVSDGGESEEFVDSSEDEVIDHASEAKFGAVGGSHARKGNDDMMVYEDKSDDDLGGIDDDKDDSDSDDDDDDEIGLEGQTVVDGLCVSKPKEKKKRRAKKGKLLRGPRIQSDPEGCMLSSKKKLNVGSKYNTAVVLDNGSGVIKLGLAGGKMPSVVEPALYGVPKRYSLQMAGMDNKKDRLYGSAATGKAGVLQLEYPMSSGFLEKWSDVEDIWEHLLYSELGIEEGDNPIIITEIANSPKKHREKLAEILFEHLSVPAMYLANQLVLSLYASGLTVGLCVSSGFSVTQAAAVYEGHLMAYTLQELDIGGQALTDNLQKLLRQNKGHNFNSSSGWQIVNTMKEKMAYVAKDYDAEMNQFKTSDALTKFYSLPDGQTVVISNEMISTVEPLFDPETLVGADDTVASQMPLHGLVNSAFKRCSPELQYDVCRNVVLSGGTTLTRGLVPRLEHELSKINPNIRSVRAPDNRAYSAWIGGSILGSLSTLDSMYATIDEYADCGGRIISQKCF